MMYGHHQLLPLSVSPVMRATPFSNFYQVMLRTIEIVSSISKMKMGMMSSHQDPYELGYITTTMVLTMRIKLLG